MAEDRIAEYLNQPGNRAAFHLGDFPQMLPPTDGEPTEADLAALAADRSRLRVPTSRPRFGTDEDGNPIEAPAGGIPWNEEEGRLMTPDEWPTEEGAVSSRSPGRGRPAPVDESSAPSRSSGSSREHAESGGAHARSTERKD